MDTEIDWQRELDTSFGRGEDLPTQQYVAGGRRAVRRRRALAGLAGLAAVAAVAGGAWAAVQTSPSNGDTRTASDVRGVDDQSTQDPHRDWNPAEMPARALAGDDDVEIRPGSVVHERRDDLFPQRGTRSVALDLTYEGVRWWIAVEWDDQGMGAAGVRSADDEAYGSFDAFLQDTVRQGGLFFGPGAPPAAPGIGSGEAER
jgi:hypothetical protein